MEWKTRRVGFRSGYFFDSTGRIYARLISGNEFGMRGDIIFNRKTVTVVATE